MPQIASSAPSGSTVQVANRRHAKKINSPLPLLLTAKNARPEKPVMLRPKRRVFASQAPLTTVVRVPVPRAKPVCFKMQLDQLSAHFVRRGPSLRRKPLHALSVLKVMHV